MENLVIKATQEYSAKFGFQPEVCVFAPGRVNLIGEHTDYNDGYVLPFSLPMVTVMVGSRADVVMTNGDSSVNVCVSDEHVPSSDEVNNITTVFSCTAATATAMENDSSPEAAFVIDKNMEKGQPKWANYVKGVISEYYWDIMTKLNTESAPNAEKPIIAFNAVIASNVPLGSGLSSSAALEVATATFLEELYGLNVNPNKKDAAPLISSTTKALRCQAAEQKFAGVPCGIMDQYISAMGKENHLLLIDCRSKKASLVPFDGNSSSPVVIITNSGVHHALGSSEYPVRVKQCQLAVDMVRQFYSELLEQDEGSIVPNPNHADIKRVKKPSAIKSLRDVSLEMLETVHKAKPTSNSADGVCCRDGESRGSNSTADASGRCPSGDGITTTPSKLSTKPQPSTSYMPSVAYRRARHVITENIRTLDSVQALSDHDWARLGQNMTESHASLSADYEVSCGEIDLLVDLALSVPGVYGSRITGGGFGGCTVTLVERQAVATFKAHVKSKYKEATGIDCVCYEVLPSAGTGVIPQTTTAALAAGSSNSVSVSGRGRTSSSSSPGNGLSKWYVITSQMTWLVPAAVFLLAIIIIVFGGNDDPTPAAP